MLQTSRDSEQPDVPPVVDQAWCMEHLGDPSVRFVEVDERPGRGRYEQGHLPGAVSWTWERDLCSPVQRDIANREQLSRLLRRDGIDASTHVVLYGDPANWFAAWAYWVLRIHGLTRLSLLDGGRALWVTRNLPLETAVPTPQLSPITLDAPSWDLRISLGELMVAVERRDLAIVDVRSEPEYTGELIAPIGMSETAQRGGHIPGASWIPWDRAVAADGTFRPRDELAAMYARHGIGQQSSVVTYCRIGERASHSWFVLHELLGYRDVRNYDGSWTEWGSVVGLPIERGVPPEV